MLPPVRFGILQGPPVVNAENDLLYARGTTTLLPEMTYVASVMQAGYFRRDAGVLLVDIESPDATAIAAVPLKGAGWFSRLLNGTFRRDSVRLFFNRLPAELRPRKKEIRAELTQDVLALRQFCEDLPPDERPYGMLWTRKR
jgi:hypothetical protein